MTTFSQLVDVVITQHSRPDMLDTVSRLVNLTCREVFFTDRNTPAFYHMARVEEQVTSPADTALLWTPADPYAFQAMETARYDDVFDIDGKQMYAREVTPGRAVNNAEFFYYRTGDSFAFSGFGGIGSRVSLSYFSYVPGLKYYPNDTTRPANFDLVSGWTYATAFDVDATTQAAARALTTHWLLMKWGTLIEEGVHAKLYKAVGDDSRAKVSFSLFQNLRESLYRAEMVATLDQ